MWTFSVSSFTSVIFIVTIRLMVTSRYFTWINLVCIFLLSLGIYFVYIWGSNYTGFSATYQSIQMIFASPQYYLSVLLCVFFCYAIDLLVSSWRFEIGTNPTDFLRRLIHYERSINDAGKEELFDKICQKVRTKYISTDFEREEKLEEKRDLRTNKYGVTLEKVKGGSSVKQIRAPRNEIELEFMQ